MARLRKACAYRKLERPYTRKSKYRSKQYVRASPNIKIVKYDMGDLRSQFETYVDLVSTANVQLRDNCLEAARLTCNRHLEKKLGKQAFHFQIRLFPHHILRENPLASGAGADRMSTGMKKSFGKSIGVAARVRENQVIFRLHINKNQIKESKEALRKANTKLPIECRIVMEE